MKSHLLSAADRLEGTRVAVLGDFVLDEFLYGEIARVSREAPVLILDHRRLDAMPGGGANAVANVRSLGGVPLPCGVVGEDEAGLRLLSLLAESGIDTAGIVRVAGHTTPTKRRVLAGLPHSRSQQIVRIDTGSDWRVKADAASASAERAREVLIGSLGAPAAAGVLISDYGFGGAPPEAARSLIEEARSRKVPVACDSRHRMKLFAGITAATPNLEEAEEALGVRLNDGDAALDREGRRLLESLRCQALLITRGSRGMTLLEDGVRPAHIPVHGTDQVADVTGAGDTVIAAFTLAIAAGITFRLAAHLANIAAGIVVLKRGTATVTAAELRQAIAALPDGPA